MKRAFRMIAFGLAGVLVTAGLTAAAFAIAGKDIAQPANPIGIFRTPEPTPSEPGNAGGDHGNGKDQATKTPGPTPSPYVDGGGTPTSTDTSTGTPSSGSLGSSPSSKPSPSGDSGGDSGSDDSGSDHGGGGDD